MVDSDIVGRLLDAFPGGFVNQRQEFIAHRRSNQYFFLENCETELDVQCKVLEWLSRGAYKTEPFQHEHENRQFHKFMLCGINDFLGTKFTPTDIEQIYTYLGNACNHTKTVRFIESGYSMEIFKGEGS